MHTRRATHPSTRSPVAAATPAAWTRRDLGFADGDAGDIRVRARKAAVTAGLARRLWACGCALALALLAGPTPAAPEAPARAWQLLPGVDLPGSDIADFELPEAEPALCQQACLDHPFCRAYTYVRPGRQGTHPRCWLKNEAPAQTPGACCSSGILVAPPTASATQENGVDLPCHDLTSMALPRADPALCKAACARTDDCMAYTYVRPGIQGAQAMCWLKDAVPERKKSDCCTSGFRESALSLSRWEPDTDRPGGDLADFEVPHGGAPVCEAACLSAADCAAWTYVKGTVAQQAGRCWLKDEVPARRASGCCISGVKRPATDAVTLAKAGVDRPGGDYHQFTLDGDELGLCRAACGAEDRCLAYTFVKPGVQSPRAVCYLKDKLTQARNDGCCSTGTRHESQTVKAIDGTRHRPRILEFSPMSPQHAVAGLPLPADMPPVRLPSDYEGCNNRQIALIQRAWARGHHDIWRAHQLMQHLEAWSGNRSELWRHGFVDRMHDPAFSYANWSPRAWFGPYDGKRFAKARRAIAKHWNERFRGRTFKAACRIDGDRQGPHPCHVKKNNDPAANHIVLGKINFCDRFFDEENNDGEEDRARLVVHEAMHWLKIPQSAWWVSDNHDYWKRCLDYEPVSALYGDKAAFIGLNGGCRDWNHNRTVINNDSYAHFANQLGRRIRGGQLLKFPAENFQWQR